VRWGKTLYLGRKLETFTFSLSAVADRFLRGERKNDPATPRSRLTTIPHLFYSYIRRGVISSYLAEIVCLPKMYTYTYIYSIRLSSQYSGREQLAIYLTVALKRVGVYAVYVYYYNYLRLVCTSSACHGDKHGKCSEFLLRT